MKATQLAATIDKAIERNPTVQALKVETHRQGEEQRRQGEEQRRQGMTIQMLKDVQLRHADEQHRQGLLLEDMQSQIQIIAEAVTPMSKRSEAIPKIENTLRVHSQEITMTQQALKRHIKDLNAHGVNKKSSGI